MSEQPPIPPGVAALLTRTTQRRAVRTEQRAVFTERRRHGLAKRHAVKLARG